MRFFIHLAYNGKNYHGWQRQTNAISVQEVIENALQILLKTPVEIVGCGRTDTGVHAKNYYLHFDWESPLDCDRLAHQLNALLTRDIVIYKLFPVAPELHARFSATLREYQYRISTRPDPFDVDFSFLFTKVLDVEAMNAAATVICSHTHFECFSKQHSDVKTFLCKIEYASWKQEEHKLVFTIRADRFLRNMVRAIVGTLLDIGTGKTNLDDLRNILQSRNRSEAGQSVPAHGLFLTRVDYPFSQNRRD